MAKEEEILDWYGILNVTIDVTKEDIEKAARKLARKYHPDRNKSADAPQHFLNVQKAKEFLLDDSKRKGYDDDIRRLSKRKEYDIQRSRNMDSKRKKMKEDLEERLGRASNMSHVDASAREASAAAKRSRMDMEEEIRKLRKEGISRMHAAGQSESKVTDEEILKHRSSTGKDEAECLVQIKVKWKRSHQSHSDESLWQLFGPFGHIEDVSLLQGKGNAAIITFSSGASATAAVARYEGSDTLQVSLVGASKRAAVFTHRYDSSASSRTQSVYVDVERNGDRGQGGEGASELMREVRRAVERDKLLQKMVLEEEGGGGGAEGSRGKPSSVQRGPASFPAFGMASTPPNGSVGDTLSGAGMGSAGKVDLATKEKDILAKMLAMQSTRAK